MAYRVTKKYGHDQGLSTTFRQWRADSHCSYIHGYALAFTLEFEALQLTPEGWVIDFGGLKAIKAWLASTFDHKTLIANDDPEVAWFRRASEVGLVDPIFVEAVGCEAFAAMVYSKVRLWLEAQGQAERVRLVCVTCHEHDGNSGAYLGGAA